MRNSRGLIVLLALALVLGMAVAQEEDGTEGKKKMRGGVRKGAAVGAVTGLALGALTGDAELAVKGAAAGAVVGAGSGVMYEYDQSRQDERTEMLADTIAGPQSGDAVPGETVGAEGKRHMKGFLGDWKLEIWVLGKDGGRISFTGKASGVPAGENATRVLYSDIEVEGYDETLGGYLLLTYEAGQGFFLENSFSFSDETLYFVGEYLAEKNAYSYFLRNNTDGKMVTEGMMRSALRVEIRAAGQSMWSADAFTHIDGKEVQVQSYRFFRP